MNLATKINQFASRSFRDIADKDYIAARLSYRYDLMPQFHWQALQAIEKYFKGIFLFNRVEARNVGHDLRKALARCEELPFKIELSSIAHEFINHLSNYGQFRYLESSWHIYGPKLIELDLTVWEIRRYCQLLNYTNTTANGEVVNMLNYELEKIRKSNELKPNRFRIVGGELEKIMDDKNHPSRSALIWKNAFFGNKYRRILKNVRAPLYAENSPLSMYPEILDEIIKYIYLPKGVVRAYRELKEKQ